MDPQQPGNEGFGNLPSSTALASIATFLPPVPVIADTTTGTENTTVTRQLPETISSVLEHLRSTSTHGYHNTASQPGMSLSPTSDPIPRGLVQRIQSGQFVEMRDLLGDNIALLNQLSSLHGTMTLPLGTVNRTRLREVPSLVSWLYCFIAYVAVRTGDQIIRDKYFIVCKTGNPRGTASRRCRVVGVQPGLPKTIGSQPSTEVEYTGARAVSGDSAWATRSGWGNVLYLLQRM